MTAVADAPAPGPAARRPPWLKILADFASAKPVGAVSGAVFLVFLIVGLLAGLISPYGPNDTDLYQRLAPPSLDHWFGTDHLGRDVFSRVLLGAQTSMVVALSAAFLATLVSIAIGVTAGYFGGAVDLVTQRFVDAWMTFPDLVLLIVVVAIVGPGAAQIIGLLALLYGIGGSRILRGAAAQVREAPFVLAAKATGAGPVRIILTHILPNIFPVAIVLFTSRIGAAMLAEAGLSFLGLGVPPPAPTWGGMLSGAGRTYMYVGPWLALAPGICLSIAVYSINMFGDALRDRLDPRMRR